MRNMPKKLMVHLVIATEYDVTDIIGVYWSYQKAHAVSNAMASRDKNRNFRVCDYQVE
jgi:hypothetical protein